MQSKRYFLIFAGILLLFLIINCSVMYSGFSSVKYFEYESDVYPVSMISEADSILENVKSSEFEKKARQLKEEYDELNRFIRAGKRLSDDRENYIYRREFTKDEAKDIVESFNISEAEALKRMNLISICQSQLNTALRSQNYISEIKKNAEKMNDTSLFSNDAKKKILHAGSKFYKLENVEISAVSGNGIVVLFDDITTDIFAFLSALISAYVLSLRLRSSVLYGKRKNAGTAGYIAVFAVSVCVMYGFNYVCADKTVGIGNPGRSVQSVYDFVQCPMAVSAGFFIILRTAVKVLAYMIVFLSALSFFLTRRKIVFISGALIFTAAEFLKIRNPENILGSYSSTKIFGEYFSTHILFFICVLTLTVVSAFISAGCIRSSSAAASEKAEKEYFEEITRKYNESRLIRHDIKNHLSAIAVLLDTGDTEGARKYIGDISEELESIKPPVKTGSGVLDALLFRKYGYAAENNIKIHTEFLSDFESGRFSDYDLCSIFSNLLDNAFEACSKFDDSRRFISLSVREQMNMICITCENHFTEIKRSSEGFVSLKSDKYYHGLGLKSISKIAEKYGGSVDIETDDNVFSVSVLLMK